MRRRRAALMVAAVLATGATATTVLAAGADPKGAPHPLPAQAQTHLNQVRGPDGKVDMGTLRLPMMGPDGQPVRNPDGSMRLFTADELQPGPGR